MIKPVVKAYYQSSFDIAVGTAFIKHDEKFKKEKLQDSILDVDISLTDARLYLKVCK